MATDIALADDTVEINTRSGGHRTIGHKALRELASRVRGTVITPSDDRYEEARHVWNGTVDMRPAIIVRCRTVEDVQAAVNFAVAHDARICIRGGGHNVAGIAVYDDAIIIDLRDMKAVTVDVDAGIARVQGGATLADIDRETVRHGRAVPAGVVSKTGIAGLALRGGFGHTMRRFGLACDNIAAVQLVTSSGEVKRIDDEETLWAIRGGPLQLGVVTEFEFRTHRIPDEVRLIMSAFPVENGIEINRFMAEFMRTAPRDVGLISFYATLPEHEELPPAVQGKEVVVLFGMYFGKRSRAGDVIGPILHRSDQIADLGGWMPYPAAQSVLDDEYPDGLRYYWKSVYLDELSDDVLDVIHRLGTQRPSPASTLDVWTLGGAIAEFDSETSAFLQRDAQYLVAIEANWVDAKDDELNMAWARDVFEELQAHSDGGIYLNFAGTRGELAAAIQSVHGPAMRRLRRIQRALDPAGLFS